MNFINIENIVLVLTLSSHFLGKKIYFKSQSKKKIFRIITTRTLCSKSRSMEEKKNQISMQIIKNKITKSGLIVPLSNLKVKNSITNFDFLRQKRQKENI